MIKLNRFPETIEEVIVVEEAFVFDHLVSYLRRAGNGQKLKQMSKTLRAKFSVASVTDFGYGSKKVNMQAVYSNKKDEDNQFSDATPSGTLEMMVSAKGAQDFLVPGKKYYLDFTEAED